MELITLAGRDVDGSHALMRGRDLVISHNAIGVGRVLEIDEQVLLEDAHGTCHAGTVADLEFTLDDTHYVLELDSRPAPREPGGPA